jgi:hypothetical protein
MYQPRFEQRIDDAAFWVQTQVWCDLASQTSFSQTLAFLLYYYYYYYYYKANKRIFCIQREQHTITHRPSVKRVIAENDTRRSLKVLGRNLGFFQDIFSVQGV